MTINPCPERNCPGVLAPTCSGGVICNAGCGYRWEPIPEVVRPRSVVYRRWLLCALALALGLWCVVAVL